MFERHTDVCTFWETLTIKRRKNLEDLILIRSLFRLYILYEFWIEAVNFFNIFSLYGRERDRYTESGTNRPKAGLSHRKRDGWNLYDMIWKYSKHTR